MNQLFVLYACLTCSSPIAIVPASDLALAECQSLAKRHTAGFARTQDPYVVKCEVRGPNDMIWILHPEWRK